MRAAATGVSTAFRRAAAALPEGGSLPAELWRRRHAGLVTVLWAHVALVPLFATLSGYSWVHALLDTAPIAALAAGASGVRVRSQRLRGALVALGLITSSAVIVHLSGGVIEAHFHFFVVLSLLMLYEAWWPFLLALAYVLVHHGALGTISPESVYAHAAAQEAPWRWALVHAAFVAAASGANIVNWKLNEGVRREARRPAEERLARVEHQLLQSQKMEAVGQLAGGVAHDFNNLLTAIGGYGELLESRLPDDEDVRGPLRHILAASDRATVLTQQLLAFSRRQVLQPKVLDLNAVVLETQTMLRRLIGEDIEITTRLDPMLGPVRTDPNQIEQALINLAVNARDAMPGGGRLEIATENVFLDGDDVDLAAGAYVRLTVSDTGFGMDDVTRAHVFEPFFTTKEPGRGTGLGLSTVYGIVRQSGGAIRVDSELYRGAVFTIHLPRQDAAVPLVLAPAPAPPPAAARGAERVLLVEDEHVVRALLRDALEAHGYDVIEAASPEEALACAGGTTVDLVVTDVVMPRMNGPELTRRLHELDPGLRVLYISGYTREAINDRTGTQPGTAFLQKPFTMSALAEKVRSVLDAERSALVA